MIDLTSFRTRIVECASCDQPVASIRAESSEPAPCPYCGAAQSVAAPCTVERDTSPYRGRPRTADGKLLPFDLVRPPPGLERLGRGRDLDALREVWKKTKDALADKHEADLEHRAVWTAVSLALAFGRKGDSLRERAILETALEHASIPIYRTMILARLARLAARGHALDLAEAWLEQASKRTGLPEADSDLAVARALIALRRDDLEGVLTLIGAHPEASAIVGPANVLAAALRVDVFERRDESVRAYGLWRRALRTHGPMTMSWVGQHFELARLTRRRSTAVGFGALALLAAIASAAGWLVTH